MNIYGINTESNLNRIDQASSANYFNNNNKTTLNSQSKVLQLIDNKLRRQRAVCAISRKIGKRDSIASELFFSKNRDNSFVFS